VSETPQGPGWWLASDGRYYPPQSVPGVQQSVPGVQQSVPGVQQGAPGVQQGVPGAQPQNSASWAPSPQGQYPQQQYPQGQYPQQQYPQPVPYHPGAALRRPGGRGCLVTFLVVVVLVVGLGVVGRWAMGRASSWFGAKTENLVGGTGCPFATDAEVSALVGGGPVKLVRAGSLTSIVSNFVDNRVIPEAPSCWGMSDDSLESVNKGRLMRIASKASSDAAKVFRDEAVKAKGDGRTVAGNSYYNRAVKGLGDEAFCTSASTSGPGSAGVLLRQGDRLVYVSLTPDLSKGAPGIGTPGRTTLSSDDPSCELAQKVARVVLTH
jgi:hypothetical protein